MKWDVQRGRKWIQHRVPKGAEGEAVESTGVSHLECLCCPVQPKPPLEYSFRKLSMAPVPSPSPYLLHSFSWDFTRFLENFALRKIPARQFSEYSQGHFLPDALGCRNREGIWDTGMGRSRHEREGLFSKMSTDIKYNWLRHRSQQWLWFINELGWGEALVR